jgi:formamidopyrimidine-DNA glycosylase
VFRCTIPEGPEVKISAELIKPLVLNQSIIQVIIHPNSRYKTSNPEGYERFIKSLEDEHKLSDLKSQSSLLDKDFSCVRIVDVNCKGKFMYWTFSNGWYMFCTFGMSGQWSPKKGKHPCITFMIHPEPWMSSCSTVTFNDPRHFGTIKFTNDKSELLNKLNDELGWDPFTPLTKYFITNKLKNSSKPIGQVLMDQSVFAGVGNYIRAEALYAAKISPWRAANVMKQDDIDTLCTAIADVMSESYKYQGATIKTYKDAYGAEGKYSSCFKIYGKKKDPLGNQIIKEDTPDKRTIHWCPTVQK